VYKWVSWELETTARMQEVEQRRSSLPSTDGWLIKMKRPRKRGSQTLATHSREGEAGHNLTAGKKDER